MAANRLSRLPRPFPPAVAQASVGWRTGTGPPDAARPSGRTQLEDAAERSGWNRPPPGSGEESSCLAIPGNVRTAAVGHVRVRPRATPARQAVLVPRRQAFPTCRPVSPNAGGSSREPRLQTVPPGGSCCRASRTVRSYPVSSGLTDRSTGTGVHFPPHRRSRRRSPAW